ncbi:MAG: ferredoxin family protein [Anaerolineaceae bacterium]|jgi:ferredoxin|nr:ferredoxin family protein [Anaerolineaceae bacterium]HPT23323.1 ferredoxin family protein [Anaerolineaceae bacterium]
MTHVITSLCLRDAGCVVACPVACIVPGNPKEEWPTFYIDPSTCIDCGACVPECPYGAIFPRNEVPEEYQAVGGEMLSAPVGTPGFDEVADVFTYEGDPVQIPAVKKLTEGEIIDLTPAIDVNRSFFETGPGYLAIDL